MNQYMIGRKESILAEVMEQAKVQDLLFFNTRYLSTKTTPKKTWKGLLINQSTFVNMGFRYNRFEKCDFQHCVFIDCYFKDAEFSHILFIGCKFINCNFEDSVFHRCDFDYANFQNCYIEFDNLYHSLPTRNNLRWKLCINLSLECLRSGNSKEYRKYFFEEKKASERYYWDLVCQKDNYHRDKYNFVDSMRGLVFLATSKLNCIIWGYGERIQNVLYTTAIMILVFAFIYSYPGAIFVVDGNIKVELNFGQALYHSLCNFITVSSGFTGKTSSIVAIMGVIEGYLGVIIIGFFVATIFRYVNRR